MTILAPVDSRLPVTSPPGASSGRRGAELKKIMFTDARIDEVIIPSVVLFLLGAGISDDFRVSALISNPLVADECTTSRTLVGASEIAVAAALGA